MTQIGLLGAFLGGVMSGWVSRVERHGVAVSAAIVVWGLSMIGMGVAVMAARGSLGAMLWVAAVFFALGGAADVISAAFRTAMMQSAATDAMRGRIQGVFLVVVAGGPRVADVLHGVASPSLGAGLTTAVGGALVVVLTVLLSRPGSPFVRYRAPVA